ncbi:hypothetical protein [Paraglaciecola sp.]|uniref:hypothetical protein n=1 Tax=Paraglaciecola sp. TaxID=1920173 RepID=UPI00273E7B40|nr:hypothetical protein [Paraglaciecola sp.]MDP5031192.1 hypothetical protein [Paraglaciecola sp.]
MPGSNESGLALNGSLRGWPTSGVRGTPRYRVLNAKKGNRGDSSASFGSELAQGGQSVHAGT